MATAAKENKYGIHFFSINKFLNPHHKVFFVNRIVYGLIPINIKILFIKLRKQIQEYINLPSAGTIIAS